MNNTKSKLTHRPALVYFRTAQAKQWLNFALRKIQIILFSVVNYINNSILNEKKSVDCFFSVHIVFLPCLWCGLFFFVLSWNSCRHTICVVLLISYDRNVNCGQHLHLELNENAYFMRTMNWFFKENTTNIRYRICVSSQVQCKPCIHENCNANKARCSFSVSILPNGKLDNGWPASYGWKLWMEYTLQCPNEQSALVHICVCLRRYSTSQLEAFTLLLLIPLKRPKETREKKNRKAMKWRQRNEK